MISHLKILFFCTYLKSHTQFSLCFFRSPPKHRVDAKFTRLNSSYRAHTFTRMPPHSSNHASTSTARLHQLGQETATPPLLKPRPLHQDSDGDRTTTAGHHEENCCIFKHHTQKRQLRRAAFLHAWIFRGDAPTSTRWWWWRTWRWWCRGNTLPAHEVLNKSASYLHLGCP